MHNNDRDLLNSVYLCNRKSIPKFLIIMRVEDNILLRKFSRKTKPCSFFILHFKIKKILCIDFEMNSEPKERSENNNEVKSTHSGFVRGFPPQSHCEMMQNKEKNESNENAFNEIYCFRISYELKK